MQHTRHSAAFYVFHAVLATISIYFRILVFLLLCVCSNQKRMALFQNYYMFSWQRLWYSLIHSWDFPSVEVTSLKDNGIIDSAQRFHLLTPVHSQCTPCMPSPHWDAWTPMTVVLLSSRGMIKSRPLSGYPKLPTPTFSHCDERTCNHLKMLQTAYDVCHALSYYPPSAFTLGLLDIELWAFTSVTPEDISPTRQFVMCLSQPPALS